MLINYRRHTKRCPHRNEGRKYRRCKCPIWVDGVLNGKEIRQSLRTKNWEKGQEELRRIEAQGTVRQEEKPERLLLIVACNDFQADLRRRRVTRDTIRKYNLLFRQLNDYSSNLGVRHLVELDLPLLRGFCGTWTQGAQTQLKMLERLRSFFRFCVISGWTADNPAAGIEPPRARRPPTMPFTRDEMVRILLACDRYPDCYGRTGQWNAQRLKALVLLLRYSGLRIGDAVQLSRQRIVNNRLFLYTQKTGVPVYVPLPEFVVEELNRVQSTSREYCFWSEVSDRAGVARDYTRYLAKLFRLAEVEHGHSHRFRDTFAVEQLLAGTPIERVSVLLGHSLVKITERYYAPWVRDRQEQVEADVKAAWARDPIVFAASQSLAKGTPGVQGNPDVPN
jgi:integrase/recombinase XerD